MNIFKEIYDYIDCFIDDLKYMSIVDLTLHIICFIFAVFGIFFYSKIIGIILLIAIIYSLNLTRRLP